MPSDPPRTVRVRLNDRPAELPAGQSLAGLLAARGLHPRTVMIEVNEQVVRRDDYSTVCPQEGDRIEIVRMIAGG